MRPGARQRTLSDITNRTPLIMPPTSSAAARCLKRSLSCHSGSRMASSFSKWSPSNILTVELVRKLVFRGLVPTKRFDEGDVVLSEIAVARCSVGFLAVQRHQFIEPSVVTNGFLDSCEGGLGLWFPREYGSLLRRNPVGGHFLRPRNKSGCQLVDVETNCPSQ